MGKLKKIKKIVAKWGDKKIRPFLKNGDAQNNKYGKTTGKSEK